MLKAVRLYGELLCHVSPVLFQTEFKQTPITAVTATATSAVQADIISTLGITRTVTVHQVRALRTHVAAADLARHTPKAMAVWAIETFAAHVCFASTP